MNQVDENKLSEFCSDKSNLDFMQNCDLTKYTSMRLSSTGQLLEVKDIAALKIVLIFLNKNKIEYKILGWGSNQVIANNVKEVWLKPNFKFDSDYLNEKRDLYHLPASIKLSYLTRHAIEFNISGWEVFTGIPAYLGGAIYMNAGTRLGEIGELIQSVKLMNPQGLIREVKTEQNSFSYRNNNFVEQGEVIIEASMIGGESKSEISDLIKNYMQKRNQTQPMNKFTCGCVFKNPENDSAGRLIEAAGLKGFEKNGIRVSDKHANFFENNGQGSYDDFKSLAQYVQKEIQQQFGINLHFEVKLNE